MEDPSFGFARIAFVDEFTSGALDFSPGSSWRLVGRLLPIDARCAKLADPDDDLNFIWLDLSLVGNTSSSLDSPDGLISAIGEVYKPCENDKLGLRVRVLIPSFATMNYDVYKTLAIQRRARYN